MPGVRIERKHRGGWLALGSVIGLHLGCGGSEFSGGGAAGASGGASSAGGRSGGPSSGGSRAGNSTGAAPNAGTGSGGSTGGTGGEVSTGCACPSGQYCREGSTDCLDCAAFSRLRFDAPERLSTLSDVGEGTLRFPRVGGSGSDLFYRSQALGASTLWYTTDSATSAGKAVNAAFPPDDGPLLLSSDVALPNLFFGFAFDRTVGTLRKLYFAQWAAGQVQGAAPGAAPFNAEGASDYSVAIATTPEVGPPRLYWMTNRGPGNLPHLATALAQLGDPYQAVALAVGSKTCAASQPDLTPWVTPDGASLLFSDTGCKAGLPEMDPPTDLYIALMNPTSGEQNGAAVLLSDVNSADNDKDPSFSRDLCDLYFSSTRAGNGFDLYRARRR